jgi:membrane-bound metal-dependent hydrolase YbcI (DUF457 family)
MMGANHAACGAAAWAALATRFDLNCSALHAVLPAVPEHVVVGLGLLPVTPVGVVTGALVTAGAAILPDADHHSSTIAHSLPPLSNALCSGLGRASGGHRHGTHSILGVVAFVAAAWLAGLWTIPTSEFGLVFPGAGLVSILLVAFAAKALKTIPDSMRRFPWAVGVAVAVFIALCAPEERGWFPVAVGVGVVVHILGDVLTLEGCNLVWPLVLRPPRRLRRLPVLRRVWRSNGFFAVPLLGHAGSLREWLLLVPVGAYALLVVGGTLAELGFSIVAPA